MMQEATAALETPLLFAPNITPSTFMKTEESEPLDLPQSDSLLFPCADDALPRRSAHNKRKPEDHIPRPPNAFILFRSSFIRSQHVSAGVETDHSTLSKIIGLTWQNLPEKERQVWHEKARIAKEEHRRRFPGYTFRPNAKAKNARPGKRTVREVFPKDVKRCAKIAELLVKGKKGDALDAAMQEFDKHHKMEIITKFEEPITAQQFARSSSAPVSDRIADLMDTRPAKRARSDEVSRASSAQPTILPLGPIAPPSLRLIIDDDMTSGAPGTASPSPVDYESVGTPFSVNSYQGFYAPPSPLDDQLLGAVHPGFHSMTEPSTPEHLFASSSFSRYETWPACSSPCSEAPETPVQGLPLDATLSHQQVPTSTQDYYEPTHFPSFNISQAKTFAELPQGSNHYYETPNPISYSSQYSQNTGVPTDFDFSTFLSTVPYGSL